MIASPHDFRSTKSLLWVLGTVGVVAAATALSLSLLRVNVLSLGSLAVPRTAYIFAFYSLLFSLFAPRLAPLRAPAIFVIPALTQYVNIALGWDFPAGAASAIRWLPFAVILILIASELRGEWLKYFKRVWIFGLGWFCMASVGALVPGADPLLAFPAFCTYGLFLPAFATYVAYLIDQPESERQRVAAALGIAGIFVIIGTLAVIRLGSGLSLAGRSGYAATRNVSDINVVLPYLLLLWPFTIWFTSRKSWFFAANICLLFVGVAFAGLSRVGMVLTPLFALLGLWAFARHHRFGMAKSIAYSLALIAAIVAVSPDVREIGGTLTKRFNLGGAQSVDQLLTMYAPGGNESLERDELRAEAVRMFVQEPLVGNGHGGFAKKSFVGFSDAHSLAFTTASEYGILGLLVVYGSILWAMIRLKLMPANIRTRAMIFASLGGWLIMAHVVGGGFAVISAKSFSFNIAPAMYFLALASAPKLLGSRSEQPEL